MKKVLVSMTMIMGLGIPVAFAQAVINPPIVEEAKQAALDEFTKIAATKLPRAIIVALDKSYEGALIKDTFVREREAGKVYKVIVTVIKKDRSTEDVTVLLNEKGEIVKE